MNEAAPFHHDVAGGPEFARAIWARASDDLRLRLGIWPEGTRGTVILMPGRTEFIEKYGLTAGRLHGLGYASIAIDWRGQGLSDRHMADRRIGDVADFEEYQRDAEVLLTTARTLGLPEPWHILAHSMGGCIALRALINGLQDRFPVRSAAFSAPMWGISIPLHERPSAWILAHWAVAFDRWQRVTPKTTLMNYVQVAPFKGNQLTSDSDMYDHLRNMTTHHPELALGGPSLRWLLRALQETRALSRLPSPSIPALTFIGSDERVVESSRIRRRMAKWPEGRLHRLLRARHELLMEKPAIRDTIYAALATHFEASA